MHAAYEDRALITTAPVRKAIERTVGALDNGWLRAAEPTDNGWVVNDWIKQAIELYFLIRNAEPSEAGPLRFYDKVPLKSMWENRTSIRIVAPAAVRFGAYLAANTVLMPCFINIGAYISEGTMVDTWATVGSCAQIGANVHLSGGVGIGGVLEPPTARPVIIDDGAFIGSRCVVVEGVYVGKEAVLGAGTVLTASTPIVDVMQQPAKVYKGEVPERAVVIPGMQSKTFPGGLFGTPCALIIGERTESTDKKTSLNDALRAFSVGV
ncbi:MAG: 2,3,4,5-tetrahydropyridine-2,6-dicarboxylate N-succinyltransferase [Candidatus Eremiobacteraeota bacterium]|nr:2,3,4,5-tetrahydropyridine-2,6-dicarboxylate N-succinyltransferase [Candidatus Eremiobacteraeota bacterium]MBV8365276.1 2,3,4,5-tetrahydropyridine-2,6-dicarboxylate N-succinyltransferase [Candidatus Eremiobacteraeota bacterium]